MSVITANAQNDAEIALDLLAGNNARGAVAVLADAARRHPEDRKIGDLLYMLLRDKRWPIAQTLPVALPAAVTVVEFSEDAKLVIAGAADGTVRILDVETNKFLEGSVKHPGAVLGVGILRGNELAFSVGKAGVARVWRIKDGSVVKEWGNQASAISACAVSKEFKHIALGYESGEVFVFDRESGKQIGGSEKHEKAITGLVLSPDGKALATASADGTARVWDIETGRVRGFIVKHDSSLSSVDFGRLNTLLLTASADGVVKITDAKSGAPVISDVKCGEALLDAKLSPSGIRFHTVLADHTVRIWDAFNGEPVEGVLRTDAGIVRADWGPAGMRIVTASDDPLSNIWRVRDGQRISEGMLHDAPVHVASYGPDARFIATGCTDGTLRVWRQDTGASSEALPSVRKHHGAVRTASFSADGKGLVSCSDDYTTIRWNMETVRPLGAAIPHTSKPACAAYSSDRSFVGTVTEEGKAFLTDGPTGAKHGEPRELGAPGRWVDFRSGSRQFVTTAGSKAVVWSVDSKDAIGVPIAHPKGAALRQARFSPDGAWIVTSGEDNTARVWEADTHKDVAVLVKHEGAVTGSRFSLDGKILVTTSADGTIVAWDTATWKQTGQIMILPGEVRSAVISPNRHFVVATSELSEGVRIFEISTGREFPAGIDLPAAALSVDIHPSGDALLVACADGTVRTYGSPFVMEDVPKWVPDFAEQVIGMRVTGPDTFGHVPTSYDQLRQFPPAGTPAQSDFGQLARWMLSYGAERTMSPRTFATIEANIQQRVVERSLESLHEIYEAAPSNPLIFAAMSLFEPSQRQGEFLAEFALARAQNSPLAQAYVASTFAKFGRMDEAERVMQTALAAAPDDHLVLRRAAKIDARQGRKAEGIAKFERAIAADQDDPETYRSYGWALYGLGEPIRAMAQFRIADAITGGADEDAGAGICLCAAAMGDQSAAVARYRDLIRLAPHWADAEYVSKLRGWSAEEIAGLERIRSRTVVNR